MCGIFGIINNKKDTFDRTAFNILGVFNDSRGGDSTGIYIDGKLEYGIQNRKKYIDFFPDSELIENTTVCKAAIGHCRKASIGIINLENAHPINIYEKNKLVFSFVHNGTIFNYKELAKKYIPNVDIKDFTDSKVLAYIIYNKQYGALAEYNGGAAFCAIDVKNNCFLFYKGASKYYSTSTAETVERPLYCIQEQNRFAFSSIKESLMVFSKETVCEFENNVLYKLNKRGSLTILRKIDRSNAVQAKPVNSLYYAAGNSYGYNNYNYHNGYYNYSNPDYNCKVSRNGLMNSVKVGKFERNGNLLDGEYQITASGYESNYGNSYFFHNGVLLYSMECWDFLELISVAPVEDEEDVIPPELFERVVQLFSVYPYKKKDGFWYRRISLTEEMRCTEKMEELFSSDFLIYKEGIEIMKVTGESEWQNARIIQDKMDKFHFDENALFSELIDIIDAQNHGHTKSNNKNNKN